MSNSPAVPVRTDEPGVLADISGMIDAVLAQDGGVDIDIEMDTRFTADLDMESIDLVALSVRLNDHYGERVNFAEFIAAFELDELFELTVGQLVRYIVGCLSDTPES